MTTAIRSARGRLLRRGQRDGERTQLAIELGGVEARPGSRPVAGAQLQEALPRPVGQYPEQVAKVSLGIEPVQASGGDQGEQMARGLGVVVAADEQPRLAADGDATELALGGIVIQASSTAIVEPDQRAMLAIGIAELSGEQAALIADALESTSTQAKNASVCGRRWTSRRDLISSAGLPRHERSSAKMRAMRARPSLDLNGRRLRGSPALATPTRSRVREEPRRRRRLRRVGHHGVLPRSLSRLCWRPIMPFRAPYFS